jgi:DNA (cytosine-5)-methyltransferase 1
VSKLRIVDLFAGWGGFTEGAEQAGQKVVWAGNHWVMAVRAHEANHPKVEHVCQDLHHANWKLLPDYDVLVASPACQGHTAASQPKRRAYHDHLRATAWVVTEAATITRPKALIVENVPTFMRWGPGETNDGSLYRAWKGILETLGYDVNEYIVDATRHGVPQRRKRLFIVATMKPGFEYKPMLPLDAPEAAVGEIIEWGGPKWSGRGEPREREWRPISGIGRTGAATIKKARKRGLGRRFVGQHVSGHPGVPLSEAIRTITCQDQWFVVDGQWYRPLTVRETARAMGFPEDYDWPEEATRGDCITGLGNAVCPPVARDLIKQLAKFLGKKGRKKAAKKKAVRKGKKRKALAAAPPPPEPRGFLEVLAEIEARENPMAVKRRLLAY